MMKHIYLFALLCGLVLLVLTRAQAQPFYDAVQKNDLATVSRLLQQEPQLARAVAGDGNTALHFAAHNGLREMTRLLIGAGADLEATGARTDHWTPLFCAVSQNKPEECAFLLNFKASVDAKDAIGNTPLHFAAGNGCAEVASVLIAKGANVNDHRLPQDNWTPLFSAAANNHPALVRLLIAHGADVDTRSLDGNGPIHYAAREGSLASLQLLLVNGVAVDSPNADGNTPLAVAAWYGQGKIGRQLLAAGADMLHKSHMGKTALDEARRAGKAEFARLLNDYQAALSSKALLDQARQASGLRAQPGFENWFQHSLQSKEVFKDVFATATIRPEWNTTPGDGAYSAPLRIAITPRGNRRFLGDFGNQAVRLALQHLPPHQEVSVQFDLYVLRSWDGNDSNVGPDVWSLRLVDGPTLLTTTFANFPIGDCAPLKTQAYPGEYPGSHNATRTGALETNSLGYGMPVDGQQTDMDAVYRLNYTFTHTGGALLLDFGAANLQELTDESWGLAKVQVSVGITPPSALTPVHPTSRPVSKTSQTSHATGSILTKPRIHAASGRPASKHAVKVNKSASVSKSTPSAPRLHDRKKPPTP